jgi:hypothetical protein
LKNCGYILIANNNNNKMVIVERYLRAGAKKIWPMTGPV